MTRSIEFIVRMTCQRQALHLHHPKLKPNAKAGVGNGIRLRVHAHRAVFSDRVQTIALPIYLVTQDKVETVALGQPTFAFTRLAAAKAAMPIPETVAAARRSTRRS